MGFSDAIRTCLSKYVDFSGRAARPEFWFFQLFVLIVQIAVAIVLGQSTSVGGVISAIASFGLLLPQLAVGTRRLHDIGRSGWWQFITLVPLVGIIVLIVFWCRQGEPQTNDYGPPVG